MISRWLGAFLLLASLSLVIRLNGQSFGYSNLNVSNGLKSEVVYAIVQDKLGYIWCGTDLGISMFDGHSYVHYTRLEGLPDHDIIKLFVDSKNRVWFISLNGSLGRIESGRIVNIRNVNFKETGRITEFCENWDGEYIFSTQLGGLYSYNGLTIKNIIKRDKKFADVGTYFTHFSNKIYVDSLNKVLRLKVYNGSGILTYKEKRVVIDQLKHKEYSISRDFALGKYQMLSYYRFGSDSILRGIGILDKDLRIKEVVSVAKLDENTCLSMMYDESCRRLFVGTSSGLYVFDQIRGNFVFKKRMLGGERISSIVCDQNHVLWVGTLGSGIFIYNSLNHTDLLYEDRVGKVNVTSIVKNTEGLIFAGFDDGRLAEINSKLVSLNHTFSAEHGLIKGPYDRLVDITFDDKGRQWLAKDKGFVVYGKGIVDTSFVIETPKKIIFSKRGFIIGAMSSGLVKIEKDSLIGDDDFLQINQRIFSLAEAKDTSLFFSSEFGFYKERNGQLTPLQTHLPVLKEKINCITEDKYHNIWLATNGLGLFKYSHNNLEQFSTRNGMTNNFCNSVVVDDDGVVWVGTNAGISKLIVSKLTAEVIRIQNIGLSQGLIGEKVTSLLKHGHKMYVGTTTGLSYFDERDVLINKSGPPIYITKVFVSDMETAILKNYEIPYSLANLKINYVGLAYRCLGKVNYQYKLEGLNNDWVSTTYTSADFKSLPPGKYRFVVRAFNEDGVPGYVSNPITIIVLPPFWFAWWFWSIFGLAASIGGTFLFKREFNRTKEKQVLINSALAFEQQALTAQMNPHFIFNVLNSIRVYLNKHDFITTEFYLTRFASLVRKILENSRESAISVIEEIKTVKLYVEVEMMRFDGELEFEFEALNNVQFSNSELPTMIIQPFLENAIWHGLAHKKDDRKLSLIFDQSGNEIIVTVIDNGIGRVPEKNKNEKNPLNKKSLGMQITMDRLTNLNKMHSTNSRVEIQDLHDPISKEPAGTKVIIYFDLPKIEQPDNK